MNFKDERRWSIILNNREAMELLSALETSMRHSGSGIFTRDLVAYLKSRNSEVPQPSEETLMKNW